MKVIVFHDVDNIRRDEVFEPIFQKRTDVVIEITASTALK